MSAFNLRVNIFLRLYEENHELMVCDLGQKFEDFRTQMLGDLDARLANLAKTVPAPKVPSFGSLKPLSWAKK